MAGLRFLDVQSRPMEFLDLTSLTLDEFQQLVPPCEAAFQAHMAPRGSPPRCSRAYNGEGAVSRGSEYVEARGPKDGLGTHRVLAQPPWRL